MGKNESVSIDLKTVTPSVSQMITVVCSSLVTITRLIFCYLNLSRRASRGRGRISSVMLYSVFTCFKMTGRLYVGIEMCTIM